MWNGVNVKALIHRKTSGVYNQLHFSVDSIMLLEEGFEVVSVDASDKMLKYALKERWNRRSEPAFNNWGELLNR